MKISIFLVNKFIYSESKNVVFNWTEEDEKRNIIELLYEKDVEELMLEDALDEISLRGSLVLRCEGSRFQGVLENYMQYDLIIGFTLSDDQDDRTYIEPYIFNITNVKQLSSPTDQNKKYSISFLDILSYTAMNHSFASVRKLAEGSLSNAKNYEALINTVYDYLVSFIQRFTLGSFTYDKVNFLENSDVDTAELVKMTINKIPQNATVLDALKIISYDACTAINIKKERLENVKKDFELFENDGIAFVPLFFKEEYLVHSALYVAEFDKDDGSKLIDKITSIEGNTNSSSDILIRSLFKRNLSMPFYFAFDKDKKIIFESLNPEEETDENEKKNTQNTNIEISNTEDTFDCISGQKISPITSMSTKFIDMAVNNSRWKNMIFLYESQSKGDGNFLLRFDWLFNLYNNVFLNQGIGNNTYTTNILPDFYINEKIGLANGSIKTESQKEKEENEKSNKTATEAAKAAQDATKKQQDNNKEPTEENKPNDNKEHTSKSEDEKKAAAGTAPAGTEKQTENKEQGKTSPNTESNVVNTSNSTDVGDEETDKETKTALYEKDYHEFNANAFLIRSEDSTKETQYYVGKMLTSFIMLNTSYTYSIEGSLFRRPNEIVKINRHIDETGAAHDPNPNAPSGLNGKSKFTMVYVTNVKHFFKSKSFTNIITANKIYDSYA